MTGDVPADGIHWHMAMSAWFRTSLGSGHTDGMSDHTEVLSSRVLLRPVDLHATQAFYLQTLGLAVSREFGSGDHRGIALYAGNGIIEISGSRAPGPSPAAPRPAVAGPALLPGAGLRP